MVMALNHQPEYSSLPTSPGHFLLTLHVLVLCYLLFLSSAPMLVYPHYTFCTALAPVWNYLLYLYDCLHGLMYEIKRMATLSCFPLYLNHKRLEKCLSYSRASISILWDKWISKQKTRNSTVSFILLSLVWDSKSQDHDAK